MFLSFGHVCVITFLRMFLLLKIFRERFSYEKLPNIRLFLKNKSVQEDNRIWDGRMVEF